MTDSVKPELHPQRLPNLPPEIAPLRARQFRIPKTFSALRHRNFQFYVAGQLLSTMGTWMQIIAQGWLVYQLSQSEFILGIVGFASAIPALLITPWGGVVVDTFPRRKLMVITQTGAMMLALILAALTFSGLVQVWHVIVLSVLLGVVNAFDGPARQAFVVDMVGREDLPNAIAINSMTFNSARVVGPAVGGFLLATVGADWCFLLNGISFLAVIASLLAMRVPPFQPRDGQIAPLQQLRSGVAYAVRSNEVAALLLLALNLSLFGITYNTVLPAFIDQILGQGPAAFGAINMASGIGAVTTAVLIARYGDRGKRGLWLSRLTIAYPLILLMFALNTSYILALLLSILLGIGFMGQFTLINTLLQTHIDDHMRGRVMSLYTLTFFGMTPFGNLAIGALSETWGMDRTLALSACLAFGFAVMILYRMRCVRGLA
ncbi:MAG: MFS transporter [Caldilineaceae bacterium]|nr:MFS transporter [Caldilineaceae bacterium]